MRIMAKSGRSVRLNHDDLQCLDFIFNPSKIVVTNNIN